MTKIAILDLETTALSAHPEHGGEPWEFGLILRNEHDLGDGDVAHNERYLWWVKPDLSRADPNSLRVNRFYGRTEDARYPSALGHAWNLAEPLNAKEPAWSNAGAVARTLAPMIDDAILLGANPPFDQGHLRLFLARNGQALTTHYRPVCITTMAAGWLIGRGYGDAPELALPWSSDAISRLLGVDPADFDRHEALGDCEWVLAQYEAITGGVA